MPTERNATVQHEPDAHRFSITVDGALAGFTEYRETPHGAFDFVHTEIDPAFGGQGLGGTLVAGALERTRELGRTIIPHCPFVAKWLKLHPDFVADVEWPGGASPVGDTARDSEGR